MVKFSGWAGLARGPTTHLTGLIAISKGDSKIIKCLLAAGMNAQEVSEAAAKSKNHKIYPFRKSDFLEEKAKPKDNLHNFKEWGRSLPSRKRPLEEGSSSKKRRSAEKRHYPMNKHHNSAEIENFRATLFAPRRPHFPEVEKQQVLAAVNRLSEALEDSETVIEMLVRLAVAADGTVELMLEDVLLIESKSMWVLNSIDNHSKYELEEMAGYFESLD